MYSILLADDEANERSGVRFLIERFALPLTVFEAANGKQAWEMMQRSPADILLSDVKMPYMDGLELAKRVSTAYPDTRILMFSAYGEFEYAKKAMEANAVNYLLKPIDVEEFHRVMDEVIASCDRRAALARQYRERLRVDKKLFWLGLLSGSIPADAAAEEQLAAFGYALNGKHLSLLHIETLGSYFADHEQRFLALLSTYAPCAAEYINSYPNAAYLLLYKDTRFDNDTLAEFADKLSRSMASLDAETVSILMGEDISALSELTVQAKKMEALRTRMFGWETPAVFAADLETPETDGYADIERQRGELEARIFACDRGGIERETKRLLDIMVAHKTLTNAYINHVFCDLIGKLYTGYGVFDSRLVQQQVSRLADCRGRQAILTFFSQMLSALDGHQSDDAMDVGYAVGKVVRIIKSEYGCDLSLDYLSESVGLAPSYLSFVFKRETGENLIKYITDYRMTKARELLESGKYKIGQIARMCGYENQSYFNRLFKNAFGVTPKQMREQSDA